MDCHVCGKLTKPTVGGKYRNHKTPDKADCDASNTFVPVEDTCVTTSDDATSQNSTGDATGSAASATSSTGSSPSGPEPAAGAEISGATEYAQQLDSLAADQVDAYRAKIVTEAFAKVSSFSQPAPLDEPVQSPIFSQPASGRVPPPETIPMTDLGKEVTARLKEMFYQYNNRKTSDNRSAQTTLGPSEIGTPCDRRLAMSLMRMPAVNPGGDGWAAFVGTCIHAGLAEMFLWANGDTGRYAVEMPLTFPSALVPRGTGDLLDRTLLMFADHKAMGKWSRGKLKSKGPRPTYRAQVHTYAYGARQRGEKVDHVAIIAWPRDESTLDDLWTWDEPYNPAIALKALKRVDGIAEKVELMKSGTNFEDTDIAAEFPIAEDCRYCPFHLPNSKSLEWGCDGKS